MGTILNGRRISNPSSYAFFGIVYTGVLATALAYFLQTWSQRHADATHSAVVLSAEPVFAAAFAVILVSEPVTNQLLVGGLLIIMGTLLSSLCHKKAMSNTQNHQH
jgi:drug/metabolite transporter (DMT)-like permease